MESAHSKNIQTVRYEIGGSDSVTVVEGIARAYGVGVDERGWIFVPDFPAHNVAVFDDRLVIQGAYGLVSGAWAIDGAVGVRRERVLPHPGLIAPHGVSFDEDGMMYISEFKGRRVSKVSPDGLLVARFGENFLNEPAVTYPEADGFVYVGDYSAGRVVRYRRDGVENGWLGSTGDGSVSKTFRVGGSPVVGAGLGAFDRVHSARLGPDGNLYIADSWNHRVVRYSATGEFLGWTGARADGSLTMCWSMDAIPASQSGLLGGFYAPIEIEFDQSGAMYVSDCYNHRIVRMELDGKSTGWLGLSSDRQPGFRWLTSSGAEASPSPTAFDRPMGLRIRNGKIYVADVNNERVLIIDAPSLGVR